MYACYSSLCRFDVCSYFFFVFYVFFQKDSASKAYDDMAAAGIPEYNIFIKVSL